MQDDDATPTDTAPEEEDETVSADGDNAEQDRADTKYRDRAREICGSDGRGAARLFRGGLRRC